MHFSDGQVPAEYRRYIGWKSALVVSSGVLLVAALITGISVGAAGIPLADVARSLAGLEVPRRIDAIVWNIRLPQALTAIMSGAGLAVSGTVMQSILRNPLGSPFTLGISHAAAFGAALSVMFLGGGVMTSTHADAVNITNPYITTGAAFAFSLLGAGVIIMVSRLRGATPEVMVLTGVALGALFTAGTMFLQYFADDVQLAAMVFWTFGDTARASWSELGVITAVTLACSGYFLCNGWNYNAIDAGDETARGLGVRVERLRIIGMLLASLVTAVIIAFLGIIGFVGLVVPHMARRIIGSDHRFLLPASVLGGGLLLLVSDTAARLILAPHLLPVSVLTAFMGAPIFIWLIIRGQRK
ncbi:MAG: iron ABC transporter permease [Pseudodesulfovibrio sp.]|uniref:Transport system permease protein n=1 Tax=Pseudodesulfovibrio aespoeensis (strain ATCC 700646 / DSM 10631 / Aspo-2) TaxID=643562 RepID=E6VRX3_PSEA9|nr:MULTISPECIES: iron ABC transporter permease [Pseudodesulfovibrio]MBU4192757.1 iron ABC transporter permease [Pseudomonadota bacterium]ADU61906.1 transport system permease protein [Pseudodesulfovibrio aespoeensis Aspo-2]MBU4243636.1 iron ABC transporter permease [Pseudomonadota bacterium]MBU4377726.1 iron ABC transporter permease [Pseudomonadota bacterium]MBU4475732.1 iron ABC transporter permease [Pseudomonadota bacterium]